MSIRPRRRSRRARPRAARPQSPPPGAALVAARRVLVLEAAVAVLQAVIAGAPQRGERRLAEQQDRSTGPQQATPRGEVPGVGGMMEGRIRDDEVRAARRRPGR